jgi:hypothetical protein
VSSFQLGMVALQHAREPYDSNSTRNVVEVVDLRLTVKRQALLVDRHIRSSQRYLTAEYVVTSTNMS